MNETHLLTADLCTDPPADSRLLFIYLFIYFRIRLSLCAILHPSSSSSSSSPSILQQTQERVFVLRPSVPLRAPRCIRTCLSPHSAETQNKNVSILLLLLFLRSRSCSPQPHGARPCRAVTRLIRQNIYNLIIKGSHEDDSSMLFLSHSLQQSSSSSSPLCVFTVFFFLPLLDLSLFSLFHLRPYMFFLYYFT